MRYFDHLSTVEDIKPHYKKLAMENHPDRGGNTATMQEINAQYAEAQVLIAQWEAPAVEEEETPAAPTADQLALRNELVARAQRLRENREYLRASPHYAAAAKIAPLEAPDDLLQEEIRQRLAGLEGQIKLFQQGDWEFVLPELWRLHRANPDDKDIVRLMVDSYYNLGLRDLHHQRGSGLLETAMLHHHPLHHRRQA